MGRAVAEEPMSPGEIRYRFQTIDRRFDEINQRFEQNEERGNVTWGKVVGLATLVVAVLSVIVGAWLSTRGAK